VSSVTFFLLATPENAQLLKEKITDGKRTDNTYTKK
jgi:hypothetical protein